MSKETYYFSHDYDSTGDPKMQAMIGNYGSSGYGIFWRIVEMLHADEHHKIPLKNYIFEAIAKQMLTNAEHVSTFVDDCINKFELFISDGKSIWSSRVIRNIEKREDISKVRSKAGKVSAEKKRQQMLTHVEQMQTGVQQNPTKERKGKEIKEKEIERVQNAPASNFNRQPIIPTKQQVWESFKGAGGTKEMAKSFYEKNDAVGWFVGNAPITNFVSLANKFIDSWKRNEEANKNKHTPVSSKDTKIILSK